MRLGRITDADRGIARGRRWWSAILDRVYGTLVDRVDRVARPARLGYFWKGVGSLMNNR
jgi:hypothetical protein